MAEFSLRGSMTVAAAQTREEGWYKKSFPKAHQLKIQIHGENSEWLERVDLFGSWD